jgi:hypothetical protein
MISSKTTNTECYSILNDEIEGGETKYKVDLDHDTQNLFKIKTMENFATEMYGEVSKNSPGISKKLSKVQITISESSSSGIYYDIEMMIDDVLYTKTIPGDINTVKFFNVTLTFENASQKQNNFKTNIVLQFSDHVKRIMQLGYLDAGLRIYTSPTKILGTVNNYLTIETFCLISSYEVVYVSTVNNSKPYMKIARKVDSENENKITLITNDAYLIYNAFYFS